MLCPPAEVTQLIFAIACVLTSALLLIDKSIDQASVDPEETAWQMAHEIQASAREDGIFDAASLTFQKFVWLLCGAGNAAVLGAGGRAGGQGCAGLLKRSLHTFVFCVRVSQVPLVGQQPRRARGRAPPPQVRLS